MPPRLTLLLSLLTLLISFTASSGLLLLKAKNGGSQSHLLNRLSKIPRRFSRSITGKLVIAISLLTLVGTSFSLFTTIWVEKKNSMSDALSYISSSSELLKKSLRYDMVTDNPEGIQKSLEFFGTSESIENVRVLDHGGQVIYASLSEEVGHRITKQSPPCTGCHSNSTGPDSTLLFEHRWTVYENPDQTRAITFAEPIFNEPDCYTAVCHAHDASQQVLGIMLTDFSLENIDTRINEELSRTSLFIIGVVASVAVALSIILWLIILKPLNKLSDGMQGVSSGDVSQKVAIQSEDEIGKLAATFNSMTDELKIARRRMEKWTQSLEDEVDKKTRQIQRTQDKLVQAEKMAALGRLTADIAHEIRNPLTALGGFGRRLQKNANDRQQRKYAELIVTEADRLERVLSDVLVFSHEARLDFVRDSVTGVIQKSLDLYGDISRQQGITVSARYGTELPVLLEKDQVIQAINNLITNAIDAMPDGGTLSVTSAEERHNDILYVAVQVADTGGGIPEDKLQLVFNPFFTTKKIGQGTGLGLSISKKIIEEHGGFILAKNRNSHGLAISLFFPYQSEEDLALTPCWEHMQCKQELNHEAKCPAYPHFGRICWAVAGTLCAGKIQGNYAQKIHDCHKCDYYQKRIKPV